MTNKSEKEDLVFHFVKTERDLYFIETGDDRLVYDTGDRLSFVSKPQLKPSDQMHFRLENRRPYVIIETPDSKRCLTFSERIIWKKLLDWHNFETTFPVYMRPHRTDEDTLVRLSIKS